MITKFFIEKRNEINVVYALISLIAYKLFCVSWVILTLDKIPNICNNSLLSFPWGKKRSQKEHIHNIVCLFVSCDIWYNNNYNLQIQLRTCFYPLPLHLIKSIRKGFWSNAIPSDGPQTSLLMMSLNFQNWSVYCQMSVQIRMIIETNHPINF